MRQERRALGANMAIAAVALALALETAEVPGGKADGSVIQIAREGQWLTHPAGPFALTADTFAQMITNHRSSGVDPAIDREHESWFSWAPNEARGWVKELFTKADPRDPSKQALFGRVEWTDIGAGEVGKKYFRYVSMGALLADVDRQTGKPIGAVLDHVAICKRPFIEGMEPLGAAMRGPDGLSASDRGRVSVAMSALYAVTDPGPGRAKERTNMDEETLKYFRALFRCPADADAAAVVAAAKQREGVLQLVLQEPEGKAVVFALTLEVAKMFGLTDANGAGLNALELAKKVGRLAEVEGELAAAKKELAEMRDREIVAEVDAAIAAKRIAPSERDEQLELARGNRALFTKLLSKREPMVGDKPVELAVKERSATPDGRVAAQKAAIDEYLKANPKASYGDALRACAAMKPDLFRREEV
jgi:phage I-like protein